MSFTLRNKKKNKKNTVEKIDIQDECTIQQCNYSGINEFKQDNFSKINLSIDYEKYNLFHDPCRSTNMLEQILSPSSSVKRKGNKKRTKKKKKKRKRKYTKKKSRCI